MIKKELYERTSDRFLALNSCGIQHFYDRNGKANRVHGRVDYHILYVKEGACYVTLDEERVVAPAGSFILYRPRERQEYEFLKEDGSTSYYIHFSGTGCDELLRELGLYDVRVAYMGKSVVFEKIFERMKREWTISLANSNVLCVGMLAELLATAAREIEMRKRGFEAGAEARIYSACHTVYERLATVSVSELARECFLSEGRFSHLFKEHVGMSPMRYITEQRIKKARELLLETELSILEIAREVGIADQNYFSRMFKKYTKVSPTEYRSSTV